jgi:hypothetical protein
MKKIVNPTMHEGYGAAPVRGFCKIEFENGKLSICGVIGPTRNGNCKGSCGQCQDEIREGKPAEGWTDEMIRKFCDIWDAWHLNDMRPYCEHQKQLGWDKLAVKAVNLYNYTLTRDAVIEKKAAEECALKALKKGETFTPTPEQSKFASLPYSVQLPEEISGEDAAYYKPEKPIYNGDKGPAEVKKLGWLRPEEHPDGLLCRPCPVCGYKYGSAWKKEEVPQDVINWLFNLPDTTVRPAWV